MVEMARKSYLPAIQSYLYRLAQTASLMKSVSDRAACHYEVSTMERLSVLTDCILEQTEKLEQTLETLKEFEDIISTSAYVRDEVLPAMETLRKSVDEAEMLVPEESWPFPSYGKILFSVY